MTAAASSGVDALLAQQIAKYKNDPLGFVEFIFPWGQGDLEGFDGPDDWQREELILLGKELERTEREGGSIQLAVASGHGIGKSALIAWLILFWMSTRPECRVVVTANTGVQLETKTWSELSLWHKRALNAHWFEYTATKFSQVAHPTTWFSSAIPWNEQRSEAFAGTHAKHVLYLFDEASAIHDVIWEVSEGAMTTPQAAWIVFGNPTRATGRFRDCFDDGKFAHRWIQRKVDSRTAKMADQKKIAEWEEDYGEDSDFFRVRVRGEFPRAANRQFIDSELVRDALARTPSGEGPVVMGVDVARFGDNDTVILVRQGDRVLMPVSYNGLDTQQSASVVAEKIKEHSPDAIFIDGVGVGGGVVDRLRVLGFEVADVNSGHRATDEKSYTNLRAEMWAKIREWLRKGGCLPHHDRLARELTAIEYDFDRRNRLMLERKDDMRRRGVMSPDFADALALTFAQEVTFRQWAQEPLAVSYGTIA